MNALQTAVAQLTTDFANLQVVVQANTFTAADVASVNTLDASVKALATSLAAPATAPTPPPTETASAS